MMNRAQCRNCTFACHATVCIAVLSSTQIAVESCLPRPLLRTLSLFVSVFFACSLAHAQTPAPQAISLDDAVRQLAERVAAIPNLRGPVHLEFFQEHGFEAETGDAWRNTFRNAIEERHMLLSDDPSVTPLRVGVAETPTLLVISAATRVAGRDETRFLSLPRTSFLTAILPVAPIRIERQLVYQNPQRILDASSLRNGTESGMVLLAYRDSVLSVLRIDSGGNLVQTIPLPSAGLTALRDPRGELTVNGAHGGTAIFVSKTCEFAWSAVADLKCRTATANWRGPCVLTPSCDPSGWKLLADGADWSTPGVLQVVPDEALREESAALLSDFPGPILSINGEQNSASAFVVSKNLRTGNYEVYKITLACGN
jgi:hypothetical protein